MKKDLTHPHQILLLHGTGENPRSFFFPWLQTALQERGYEVTIPDLRGPLADNLEWATEFLRGQIGWPWETSIIARSSAPALVLNLLQSCDINVSKAIFIAGFLSELGDYRHPYVLPQYDWPHIQANIQQLVCICSDNDPWSCGELQARKFLAHLPGSLRILSWQGHFGSDSFQQPYPTFPELLEYFPSLTEITV